MQQIELNAISFPIKTHFQIGELLTEAWEEVYEKSILLSLLTHAVIWSCHAKDKRVL